MKVESTSSYQRRTDVILSTCIHISWSMKYRWTFDVEIRCRIDAKLTKMSPLAPKLVNIKFYKLVFHIIVICNFSYGIFFYLWIYFVQKNSTIHSRKTSITQDWLVVESCPTSRWIVFLLLFRLVYNIRSHFNELNLA